MMKHQRLFRPYRFVGHHDFKRIPILRRDKQIELNRSFINLRHLCRKKINRYRSLQHLGFQSVSKYDQVVSISLHRFRPSILPLSSGNRSKGTDTENSTFNPSSIDTISSLKKAPSVRTSIRTQGSASLKVRCKLE